MGANLGTPAYQGFLRNDSATIAEVLRASGYRTLMSGKWHVAGDFMAREVDSWRIGDIDHPTPRQRGFDRFYGIVDGVTNFFSPHFMLEDDDRVEVFADDFYFTDALKQQLFCLLGSDFDWLGKYIRSLDGDLMLSFIFQGAKPWRLVIVFLNGW